MNNRIIQTAIMLTRFTLALNVLLFGLMAIVLLYGLFTPEFLEKWYITQPLRTGAANINFSNSSTNSGIVLSDLGSGTLLWLFGRMSIFFVLIFLSLKKVLSILISVKTTKTFFKDNVTTLRSLAKLGLAFAILACFNIGSVKGEFFFNLAIPFTPLLYSAGCWVLSEIFLEGSRLSEDSNSII